MDSATRSTMNRREFLAATAATAGGLTLESVGAGPPPSPDVVLVRSDFVARGPQIHQEVLGEMLDSALQRLTATPNTVEAWRRLLRSDDMIGLKFNRSGAEGLGVSGDFADTVIASLLAAGFEARQIVAIEAPEETASTRGLPAPADGWQAQPTDFGSGQDQLANVLDQVTAIINIPFLKNHNITGVTGACKNLSHALVKHPARFHDAHCSPYIADIVALPQIRSKLRLHLVNALRVVFDGGPEVSDEATWDAGMVLAGTDPVAVDSLGLEIINAQRSILGLADVNHPVRRTRFLEAAAARGLGRADARRLEVARIRI